MKETVRINGLTMCHKGSDGLTMSTLPDICRSPGAPIPYINIAFARDLVDGSISVTSHGGKMCAVRGSRFEVSEGDEPGRGKGVISRTVQHEATWLSWSPNVYIEGRPATRLSDRMLMNKGNTASLGGYQTAPLNGSSETRDLLCKIGCECYAKLRPRRLATELLDKAASAVSDDDEKSPGRYQRCVEATLRATYPNAVIGPTIVGEDYVGNGYLPEVGFWDPLNPNNLAADKEPGKVILEGDGINPPFIPRQAPWGGAGWFNVRGSRWLDVVRVQNGQMTEMYDMKFPGDKFPNVPDKDAAYKAIARKHRATYDEFVVLEQCDDCKQAIDDYESEREYQQNKNLRDIENMLKKAPLIFLPPGRGGRIPRPSPVYP
ncbi:DUF4150 domain-containing protein [Paracoccus aminophilus]|uniref:Uncharacterized protein n=1 Tax=Paracoccus aminophilus JCM 7686 TaxID=1367847 RepID=S5YV64_PARAH|nr:DUF4150 domain-containing protein [Paracoccus aminophilus]AGT09066.1 hypothetical protein JCM7686_1965 [Paracoccus aminophilus JCM 7686]